MQFQNPMYTDEEQQRLDQAAEDARKQQLMASLAQAGSTIGGAISGQQYDQSFYDKVKQNAQAQMKQAQGQVDQGAGFRLDERRRTEDLSRQEDLRAQMLEREDRHRSEDFAFQDQQRNKQMQAAHQKEFLKQKLMGDKELSKQQFDVQKENRKVRQELDSAESKLQETIKQLESDYALFEDYSKNSTFGTGPLATGWGTKTNFDADLELLNSRFNKISLDEMVKMFAGMSKAVDSDAERRAFEATQPNIKLDDTTNRSLLTSKIVAAQNLLKKTREAKEKYDRYGAFRDEDIMPAGGQTTDPSRPQQNRMPAQPTEPTNVNPSGSKDDIGSMPLVFDNDYYKRIKMDANAGPDQVSPFQINQLRKAGMVTVESKDGKDRKLIDPSDLKEAQAAGYKVVE